MRNLDPSYTESQTREIWQSGSVNTQSFQTVWVIKHVIEFWASLLNSIFVAFFETAKILPKNTPQIYGIGFETRQKWHEIIIRVEEIDEQTVVERWKNDDIY